MHGSTPTGCLNHLVSSCSRYHGSLVFSARLISSITFNFSRRPIQVSSSPRSEPSCSSAALRVLVTTVTSWSLNAWETHHNRAGYAFRLSDLSQAHDCILSQLNNRVMCWDTARTHPLAQTLYQITGLTNHLASASHIDIFIVQSCSLQLIH